MEEAVGAGRPPAAAHRLLFGRDSYLEVQPADYADLLRGAGRKGVDLLEQSPQGLVMLGSAGEQLVQGRDFYGLLDG